MVPRFHETHVPTKCRIEGVSHLDNIKTQFRLIHESSGQGPEFNQYNSLLLAAATDLDNRNSHGRRVNNHEISHTEQESDDDGTEDTDPNLSIDALSVNEAKLILDELSVNQAKRFRPTMPKARWTQLSKEQQNSWDEFPDDAKCVILGIKQTNSTNSTQGHHSNNQAGE